MTVFYCKGSTYMLQMANNHIIVTYPISNNNIIVTWINKKTPRIIREVEYENLMRY